MVRLTTEAPDPQFVQVDPRLGVSRAGPDLSALNNIGQAIRAFAPQNTSDLAERRFANTLSQQEASREEALRKRTEAFEDNLTASDAFLAQTDPQLDELQSQIDRLLAAGDQRGDRFRRAHELASLVRQQVANNPERGDIIRQSFRSSTGQGVGQLIDEALEELREPEEDRAEMIMKFREEFGYFDTVEFSDEEVIRRANTSRSLQARARDAENRAKLLEESGDLDAEFEAEMLRREHAPAMLDQLENTILVYTGLNRQGLLQPEQIDAVLGRVNQDLVKFQNEHMGHLMSDGRTEVINAFMQPFRQSIENFARQLKQQESTEASLNAVRLQKAAAEQDLFSDPDVLRTVTVAENLLQHLGPFHEFRGSSIVGNKLIVGMARIFGKSLVQDDNVNINDILRDLPEEARGGATNAFVERILQMSKDTENFSANRDALRASLTSVVSGLAEEDANNVALFTRALPLFADDDLWAVFNGQDINTRTWNQFNSRLVEYTQTVTSEISGAVNNLRANGVTVQVLETGAIRIPPESIPGVGVRRAQLVQSVQDFEGRYGPTIRNLTKVLKNLEAGEGKSIPELVNDIIEGRTPFGELTPAQLPDDAQSRNLTPISPNDIFQLDDTFVRFNGESFEDITPSVG